MTLLTASEQATLVILARAAVEARVLGEPAPLEGPVTGTLAEPGAAFVSVYVHDDLRGCLGCIEPRGPSLAAAVVDLAAAAATDDPRFDPVRSRELPAVRIEVSVLGPLVAVTGAGDIVIGRDGLVVEQGACRGLLLPQVAVRWGWSPEEFLAQTCRKAGLPRTAWQESARIHRFEADVFGDEGSTSTAGNRTPAGRSGVRGPVS